MNDIPEPEILFNFSDTTLQDLLMASLGRQSRLIKQSKECWQAAVREEAIAIVAGYVLRHRKELDKRLREVA